MVLRLIGMTYSIFLMFFDRISLWFIVVLEAFFGILAALFLKRVTGEHFDSGPWIEEKKEDIVRATRSSSIAIQPEQMVRSNIEDRAIA